MLPFIGPAGQSDTRLFLSVDSPESIALMFELWDGHSGAPGLLNAVPAGSSRQVSGYVYDQDRRVFVNTDTGKDVTDEQLIRYVRKISDESSRRMKKSTQQLIAGIIILNVWYSRMRDLMRALYKTVWLLAIGGFVFDDDASRNLFYLFVLIQFNYLDNFAEQLNTGEQAMDGRAMTRAGLYGSYGNGLHQNIELSQAELRGRTAAIRILGDNENHCEDDGERPGCVDLALQGWISVREMIPIGDAACYTSCHCRIKYR